MLRSIVPLLVVAFGLAGCVQSMELVRTSNAPHRASKDPADVEILDKAPSDRRYQDVGTFVYREWLAGEKFDRELRVTAAREGCDAVLITPGSTTSPSCLQFGVDEIR